MRNHRIFQNLAVREGFEPSIRYERIHAFQACSFNRSDTSPLVSFASGSTLGQLAGSGLCQWPRTIRRLFPSVNR